MKREFNLVRVDKGVKTLVEIAIAGTKQTIGQFFTEAAKEKLKNQTNEIHTTNTRPDA